MKIKYLFSIAALLTFTQVSYGQNMLAQELAARDSLLFNAILKTCNIEQVKELFTAGFSYEQDKGDGHSARKTSRSEFIDNIQRRCAAKTTAFQIRRVLVPESTISLLGHNMATQTGIQRFFLKADGQPERMVEESHLIRLWVLENDSWKISYELDYQINTPSPQDAAIQSDSLFKQVIAADSALFAAYNRKDIGPMKEIFAKDLEFYHDKGGLSHYEDNIQNFEQKFKDPGFYSRREVDLSSLKVYPLNNYGAVQMGTHRFYSMENGTEVLTAIANFINTWHYIDGRWQLERIISYDHR